MRLRLFVVLLFAIPLQAIRPQTAGTPSNPTLPKEPRAILEAARPLYDFSDPSLKPWHLKASYQLYDDQGNPSEQGTYEYWWASPKVYRSTWTRAGAVHTDWHTADDKHAYLDSGGHFSIFEYKLQSALFHPLPEDADLDPAKIRFERQDLKMANVKIPCIMIVPIMPQHGQTQVVPLGLFPTYCFNPAAPALQIEDSFGTIAEYLDHIVKVQGRYVPRDIKFFEGKQKVLFANVETIDGISATDPVFAPAPAAVSPKVDKIPVAAGLMVGMLLKKQQPVYPQDAKDAHVSGTVVLQATIGRDGRIHALHVLQAPWPSLVASALISVSKWEYKPYLLNGEPVEVETTINVIYSLGG
jgi:TonB family protein